ncbi:unnamed protein product [Penicillium salamii]|uniref:Cytidine deaminase n=1 Tax=Penicillium salamii TaxID=1612424 RepID=A0A9W4NVT4_9EURO|nr:unnamed protein product [Penicillium salamii]CAG8251019.1 unnamed protein product [Penicillium salamii]CAG8254892.1 unnamed protein product [Penicillium salamii]CAG8271929.1 unnamed protein product [Penicillium salamii]CAG8274157.1 unnamed protein product [Penicillium salamii]
MSVSAQELEILSTKAIAAKGTAYCPYSKFQVGACILTTTGEFIIGANVENAAYPVGTCAERVAFGTAVVSCGCRDCRTLTDEEQVAGHKSFKALAVATNITPAASPCGMCRQFIREFTGPDFPIYMYDGEGNYKMMTMDEVSIHPRGVEV